MGCSLSVPVSDNLNNEIIESSRQYTIDIKDKDDLLKNNKFKNNVENNISNNDQVTMWG